MLNNDEIVELLNGLPVRSYKYATSKEPMKLSTNQANALGIKSRNVLRIVKTAIQAIADKLFIDRVTSETSDVQPVEDWLATNRFETLQRDLYKIVVRDGLAYIQVKYEDRPTLALIESYDGRTGAASYYDPATKKELFVVNVWYAGTTRNVDIYYPDRIEKYTYDTHDGLWKPRKDVPNEVLPIDWTDNNNTPLGIALVRFDISESDIVEAVQLQNDINEAILDMLATSRTMGWPQRVLKNASQETYLLNQYEQPLYDSIDRSYPIPRKIELTPGSILMLQGTNSDLEQLPQAEPNTTVLETLRSLLSQVTTVPQYVFNGGEYPSGVALLNAEMRLNHKVESHQGHLTPAYESMFDLMVRVNNTFAATSFDINASVVWTSPEVYTLDLQMELAQSKADYVMKLKTAGVISTEQAVRELHEDWDETQIQNEVARIQAENTIAGI